MMLVMTSRDDADISQTEGVHHAASPLGIWLLCGGALALLLAGLLLWWREGDRLFTDGLIAAIVACF